MKLGKKIFSDNIIDFFNCRNEYATCTHWTISELNKMWLIDDGRKRTWCFGV